jgi:hypothetical protein
MCSTGRLGLRTKVFEGNLLACRWLIVGDGGQIDVLTGVI